MIVGIREMQSMVNELGVKIGAPKSLLTILSAPADDGAPYIKVDASSYSYVSSERGCEIFNKSTCSLDELLFWIMSRVAQQMAVRYELENRTASGDTRRIYFAKYIQLLGELNSAWAERGRKYVDDVLMISPLLDD